MVQWDRSDGDRAVHCAAHMIMGASGIHARGGSRIPRRRGRQPFGDSTNIRFCKMFQKLHEIEKILGRRGRGAPWIHQYTRV